MRNFIEKYVDFIKYFHDNYLETGKFIKKKLSILLI